MHFVAQLRRSSRMSLDNLCGISLPWEGTSECALLRGEARAPLRLPAQRGAVGPFCCRRVTECVSFLSSHGSIPVEWM